MGEDVPPGRADHQSDGYGGVGVDVDMGVVMATDPCDPLLLSEAKGRIGARPPRACLPMIVVSERRRIRIQA